jgi:hypothetical protein
MHAPARLAQCMRRPGWCSASAGFIVLPKDCNQKGSTMATALTAALVALQVAAAQQQPDTSNAYLDSRAAELVALSRQARSVQHATLAAYRASARERASAVLRTPGRDRLLYRREMAADLEWRREGPSTVTLLGAREYVPLPGAGVRVLPDAAHEALDIVFEPHDFTDYVGLGNFRFGAHPLRPGGEADYQFRSGESTTLELQGGRTIVLHELVVIPRRAAPELVSGAVWIEDGTGRLVQEAYRKAAPIAGSNMPVVGRISIEPREILIEHALWDLRWWLPRAVAINGFVRAGTIALVPFRYERTYDGYQLEGVPVEPEDTPEDVPADTPDPAVRPAPQRWRVVLPDDRADLLTSAHLPGSIFGEDAAPIPAEALAPLRMRLDAIALPPLELGRGTAFLHLAPLDGIRFNRVEGLSFNVRGGVDLGGIAPFADARVATAGRVLRGQAGVQAITGAGVIAAQAYDRVYAADPVSRPFDAGNSFATFLFGDDYGHYFAAQGVELVRSSSAEARAVSRAAWTVRVFAEQQDSVVARGPLTLSRLWGGTTWRRAGLPVVPATQYGGSLEMSVGGGLGPEQAHWRVVNTLGGAFGDFDYGQASLTAGFTVPLPLRMPTGGGVTAAVEAAGGTSFGTLPGQALWHLGGASTVRGYPAASAAGAHFWRARVEAGTAFPAVRATIFADAARAYGEGGFEGQPSWPCCPPSTCSASPHTNSATSSAAGLAGSGSCSSLSDRSAWSARPDGFRPGLNRSIVLSGGLAAMTPIGLHDLRRRTVVMVAMGPVASLMVGAQFLALYQATSPRCSARAPASAHSFRIALCWPSASSRCCSGCSPSCPECRRLLLRRRPHAAPHEGRRRDRARGRAHRTHRHEHGRHAAAGVGRRAGRAGRGHPRRRPVRGRGPAVRLRPRPRPRRHRRRARAPARRPRAHRAAARRRAGIAAPRRRDVPRPLRWRRRPAREYLRRRARPARCAAPAPPRRGRRAPRRRRRRRHASSPATRSSSPPAPLDRGGAALDEALAGRILVSAGT